MWIETEGGIMAKADATVFRLLMDGGRTERRLLAAGRTINAAYRRVASIRRMRDAMEAQAHAAATMAVEREFGPSWGSTVRVRVAPAHPHGRSVEPRRSSSKSRPGTSERAIHAYLAPLVDSRGRAAIFFRIRYVGFKSKQWRAGLAADHAIYILREEAQEIGETSLAVTSILSNMGETAGEIAACWQALEAVEEGYRANAAVQYRIIWNLPHGLDIDDRRELVGDFCKRTFGRLGLPWVAAIHKPDERGDQRNYHAHICFSTRPCEHIGDHGWEIAQEKVNGLTDPGGLKLLRALAAGHMNIACRDAGLALRFTHQTYQERGIDAQRQEHVGPGRMAAHQRGEKVAVIERNARIVERNEAAAEEDETARKVALSRQLATLLERGVRLAAERRRLTASVAAIGTIAERARSLGITRPRPPLVSRVTAARVAQDARAVHVAFSTEQGSKPIALRPPQLDRIAALARAVADRAQSLRHCRAIASGARARLEGIQHRIAAERASHAVTGQQLAEALLLNASTRPYQGRNGRLFLDVSALTSEQAAMVRSLSIESLQAVLDERRRRDLEQDAAAAQASARTVEEARATAEHRRQQVEAACRILRDTPERPYRREGTRLIAQLARLSEADRTLVARIGFGDRDLAAALVKREQRDRAADDFAQVEKAAEHERAREALKRLFDALEQERHWLGQDDGRWIVPPPLLARVGLTPGTVADAPVQLRLEGIAKRDSNEVAQITDYIRKAPDDLQRQNDGSWAFDAGAPTTIRAVINRWRHDATMQAALESAARVAARHSGDSDAVVAIPGRINWRHWRHAREQAMAGGDAAERLGGTGLNTPGRGIARPGAEPLVSRQPLPRPPGMGFGD